MAASTPRFSTTLRGSSSYREVLFAKYSKDYITTQDSSAWSCAWITNATSSCCRSHCCSTITFGCTFGLSPRAVSTDADVEIVATAWFDPVGLLLRCGCSSWSTNACGQQPGCYGRGFSQSISDTHNAAHTQNSHNV